MFRSKFRERKPLVLKIRIDAAFDYHSIIGIGSNLYAVLHQLQPFQHKLRKQDVLWIVLAIAGNAVVKVLPGFHEQGFRPLFVSLNRKPCTDGFGLSIAKSIIEAQNNLKCPVFSLRCPATIL